MEVQPTCPRCKDSEETVLHALKDCVFAKEVWTAANLSDVWYKHNFSNHDAWLSAVAGGVNQEHFDKGLVLCRAIWYNRNKMVKNQRTSPAAAVCRFAEDYLAEFKKAQDVLFHEAVTAPTKWLKPDVDKVKVNFDGALRCPLNAGGVGIVIRDHEGFVLGACAEFYEGVTDSLVIESIAAVQAILFAADMGFRNIILEGDCLQVIQNLTTTHPDLSAVGTLTLEAQKYFSMFQHLQVKHTKREGNVASDILAKHALAAEANFYWVEECPLFLHYQILLDCNFD
ncbi:hypothetical protein REPUB_Repub19eG0019000 [Reevesia pubescens]